MSLADIAAWLAVLVGLATTWLYLAGWTYAYAYFDRFNLPIGLAETSTNSILIYGFWTLFGAWWVLPAIAACLLALALLVQFRRYLSTWLVMGSAGLLVLLLFHLAHLAGQNSGLKAFAEQSSLDYAAYPRVAFGLTSTVDRSGPLPILAENDCARLLVSRSSHVVLVRPRKSAPALPLQSIVVPLSSIEWLRITDIYESCE